MIVFDLDDTLYFERDFESSGRRAIRRHLGPGFSLAMNGKWTPEMLDVYHFHKPDIKLKDDALTSLEYLSRRGVKLGIITDGRSVTQRNKIKALGLDKYIDESNIIISEEIGHEKLSGIPFEKMMERNADESTFVYIGDNPAKDFLEANRLGWHTVMIHDGEAKHIHRQNLPDDTNFHPKETVESIYQFISHYC